MSHDLAFTLATGVSFFVVLLNIQSNDAHAERRHRELLALLEHKNRLPPHSHERRDTPLPGCPRCAIHLECAP